MQNCIFFDYKNHFLDTFSFLKNEMEKLEHYNHSVNFNNLSPNFEIKEDNETVHIKGELPGFKEEYIDLTISNQILTISGKTVPDEVKDEEIFHLNERKYGGFQRSFKLSFQPNQKDIFAKYKDGILKIVILKPASLQNKNYKIAFQPSENEHDSINSLSS